MVFYVVISLSIGHLLNAMLSNGLISRHTERNFAVVRRSDKGDSGKLSEAKTDTIAGYNDSKMDQHEIPISTCSAAIEWRHGRRTASLQRHHWIC